MYKMIISDLDDTLLRSDATISARTERALFAAREAGARVLLASGRMTRAMRPYARQLKIADPMIAFNGGQVTDPVSGDTIFTLPIGLELAREALAMAEDMGLYIQAYFGDDYYFWKRTERSDRYARAIGVEGIEAGVRLSEFVKCGCVKLLLIDEPERIPDIKEKFVEAFGDKLSLVISRPNYIEFTDIGATKHDALARVAKDMGILPGEILAFGDGQNDMGMLRMAGRGYAPLNAREDVLAEAPATMPSNDEDGVAQIVESLIGDGLIGR